MFNETRLFDLLAAARSRDGRLGQWPSVRPKVLVHRVKMEEKDCRRPRADAAK